MCKKIARTVALALLFLGSVNLAQANQKYDDECIENPNRPEQKCAVDYGVEKKEDRSTSSGSYDHNPNSAYSNSVYGSTHNNGSEYGKAQEQCVVVKGSASVKDVSKAFARKMAIRDALQQASLKNNVVVKTDQSVEGYQVKLDSIRFISNSKVKSFDVLKEGYEEASDMYGKTKT